MEQNLAILIADLSGYTALTETHGPGSAADMIDKFLDIVENCLVGDCTLHQRVGDEVLIVSQSPDHLLNTAVMLMQKCSAEHHFLQLHGGLHYGKLLKRNDHYFGAPLNLTSRIAAKASKGCFWCSQEFRNELLNPSSAVSFSSKGKHQFKNVSGELEVFELQVENTSTFDIDPVCRMVIQKRENAIQHPTQKNVYFCSEDCLYIYSNTLSHLPT
jgi:class 3 adenylate cyclase/YHS domain-containing protein